MTANGTCSRRSSDAPPRRRPCEVQFVPANPMEAQPRHDQSRQVALIEKLPKPKQPQHDRRVLQQNLLFLPTFRDTQNQNYAGG
eukprot:10328987-Heterocapsa_arctica.AAC.1